MSNFGNAFRAARNSGAKTFTFNGKSYTTKLKSEVNSAAKTPKAGPLPTPRPSDRKPSVAPSNTPPVQDDKTSTAVAPVPSKAGYPGDGVKRPTPAVTPVTASGYAGDGIKRPGAAPKSTPVQSATTVSDGASSDPADTMSDRLQKAKARAAATLAAKAGSTKLGYAGDGVKRPMPAADDKPAKRLVRGRNGLMVR
ncbi:hypothetical protein LAV84_05490 [Rhizobium sp. VS19-DR104.2]|uniref:hypothetical protein n=1 Tax=unclassified Rhizobium TaxID=2613769 RepID=UPI001C5B0B11|nr:MULTISPECIES: hypothetical protein [unclassified Rhizobium]MBZ5759679.1 hypothetical protein [Rhizobium sp. VS19-DR96]MBZ5766067.1 hypothetical protein [Rhizobium sp. VS19-DR129.2]MBZ5772850.1 hypothetical protein [Rhizobium sp. VS19-DRK62.2]MBZ5786590.1 hypothetical protein [Rhizobium sp. VS19-DR121]MBZ5804386.1 hypothetical protein [Rhizobium sp. VS19-DR181]